MQNSNKAPDIIQKSISSIYVIKSGVLNDLLIILNISNTIPINIPTKINIIKVKD